MNNSDNILIIKGPPNLLSILKNELGDFDLDEDSKFMRRWCRIPPKKTLYHVYFNNTEHNQQLFDTIQMEIADLDPKAVVKYSKYMVEDIDKIGQYMFVYYSGKNKCTDILDKLHKSIVLNIL